MSQLRRYSTYAPAAVASLGRQPWTWESRSVVLMMRPRTAEERIERFDRRARELPIWGELASKSARWAADNLQALMMAQPEFPRYLADREVDAWDCLFAIADTAGQRWSLLARYAARELSKTAHELQADDEDIINLLLLSDIREIFNQQEGCRELSSCTICSLLARREDRSWAAFGRREEPISQIQLARRLADFEIYPMTVHPPDKPSGAKGYRRNNIEGACNRYLKQPVDEN